MSAAATAAGYLYASGRLPAGAAHEQEQQPETKPGRKAIRVDVLPPKTPKIEYRTRKRRIAE